MNKLPIINAFWVGSHIGRIHAACLQSFARQGHRVVLHVYEPPQGVPKGVEIADASVLLPRDRLIPHRKTGSHALSSDLFRYELMAADAGVYVDCDCYCFRPLVEEAYMFGWEDGKRIDAAVLRIPSDSPLLDALRAIGTTRGFVPPWEKPKRRYRYKTCALMGMPVPLSRMGWGTAGPTAVTYYVKAFNLLDKVKPIDEYYPVHYNQIDLLYDPDLRLEDIATPRTRVFHLWNKFLSERDENPPATSPLGRVIRSLE